MRFTFSTKSFLIRYCEEEVELGDVGQFRLELGPAEPLGPRVEAFFKAENYLKTHVTTM